MIRSISTYITIYLLLLATTATAQAVNTYSTKHYWTPLTGPFSPVVNSDHRITFRVKAPKASVVQLLFGEWDIKPQPMTRDSAGNWGITIGPVMPGIYSYLFTLDGAKTIDLANSIVKIGTELYGSIVEVPGTPARFDEIQAVPHGITQVLTYTSTPLQKLRSMHVYLPPDYFTKPAREFPVLYLRHGGGDNESSWGQESGRAQVILENLLAKKEAVPMIIVMSNGLTDGSWAGGSTKEGMVQLEQELLKDIIPLIEKQYRVETNKGSRAIAGLSMGGGQAYIMGLRHLDHFSWIGEFSAGILSDPAFDINERIPGIYDQAAIINKQLKLLWIGCGTDDPRIVGHQQLAATLKNKGIRHEVYNIPGGHEWKVWREELHRFLPKLFR
jgi:enterochelin esterase-like enzyme